MPRNPSIGAQSGAHPAASRHYEATLEDGRPLLFRLIRPDDKDLLLAGFQRLSDHSRYERFFTHLESLSAEQLRYLTEVDHKNHSAWIAIAETNASPVGAGVGRWVRLKDDPECAEVAVTVVDEFQRRGLGRTLLYLCATSALEHGIRAFRAWVLGSNHATLTMLERIGATRGKWEAGVFEVTVPLLETVERADLVPLELKPFHAR